MSDSEEYESAISFWNTLDNLATVTEDVLGEHLELIGEAEYPGWKADSNELIRLKSEGEETVLDEEYLSCLTRRIGEDHLLLSGVEDEYFESLPDLVG